VETGRSTRIILEGSHIRAEIGPEQGARVRSLIDLRNGRELLYRRPAEVWDRRDYIATLAGGWDQMFPNDDPWREFPVHGVHWTARFRCEDQAADAATLTCALTAPAVTIEHRYELLVPPRAGLRLTTRVQADAAVDPFLWSTHPMLAVGAGWAIRVDDVELEADRVDLGRVAAGPLSTAARDVVLVVPEGGQGWQEVLYAPAAGVGRQPGWTGRD
jgi:hypothetical protein